MDFFDIIMGLTKVIKCVDMINIYIVINGLANYSDWCIDIYVIKSNIADL